MIPFVNLANPLPTTPGTGLTAGQEEALTTATRRQPVASIAALKALTPQAGDAVNVLGYYAAGDGGGGTFYYDSTSVASDNGGTVIAPNAGGGRWIRAYSGPVNAKWFSTAADLVAFATAQAAAGVSTRLYFPSGTYDCSGVVFGPRMIIEGDGFDSNLTNTPTFTITDTPGYKWRSRCSSVRFEDGISISKCVGVLFDNVHFSGPVVFHPTNLSYYNTFLSCVWNYADTAIDCQGLNNFNTLINCKIAPRPGNQYGIKIQTGTGAGPANGWSIISLSYELGSAGTYGPAIDIDGASHIISGGYFECPTYNETLKTIYVRAANNTIISPRIVATTNAGIGFSSTAAQYGASIVGLSPQKATSHLSVWNATTTAAGKYTIAHGLMATPRTILITSRTPGVTVNIDTFDATNVTVIAYNVSDGSVFASQSTLKAEIMLSVSDQF